MGLSRESEVKEKPVAVDFKNLRVLVIDDNTTNRLILRETLSSWEAEVTLAENGAKGLEALSLAEQAGKPFHLVLLDGRSHCSSNADTIAAHDDRFLVSRFVKKDRSKGVAVFGT